MLGPGRNSVSPVTWGWQHLCGRKGAWEKQGGQGGRSPRGPCAGHKTLLSCEPLGLSDCGVPGGWCWCLFLSGLLAPSRAWALGPGTWLSETAAVLFLGDAPSREGDSYHPGGRRGMQAQKEALKPTLVEWGKVSWNTHQGSWDWGGEHSRIQQEPTKGGSGQSGGLWETLPCLLPGAGAAGVGPHC